MSDTVVESPQVIDVMTQILKEINTCVSFRFLGRYLVGRIVRALFSFQNPTSSISTN